MSIYRWVTKWLVKLTKNTDDKAIVESSFAEEKGLGDSNIANRKECESTTVNVCPTAVMKHAKMTGSASDIQARIKQYLMRQGVKVSEGVIESIYKELGELPEIDIIDELDEAISQYKKFGVFSLKEIPYIDKIIDKNGHMVLFEQLALNGQELSEDVAVKKAIEQQLKIEGITHTEFRLNSLTKDYINGNFQPLSRMINEHRTWQLSLYKESKGTAKAANRQFIEQGAADDLDDYCDDYDYSNISYSEVDTGGGTGDDMDSFDYADDYGSEEIR